MMSSLYEKKTVQYNKAKQGLDAPDKTGLLLCARYTYEEYSYNTYIPGIIFVY